ncbi:hypothetical protein VTK73DRAFT_6534 [Phialemonium thermophilum]|uniref:NAD(P)-binding domain-containing protein n=1 Tax=Phialemonium thermophilum TaxID=223376 RepID=A0ABR3XVB1_9PEZI
MAPKIFLTGVTGYIGGDAFYALQKAHPDFDYTLLVRNEARGKLVKEKYPNVRLVYGTLDDAHVISKAAAAADIVVHTAESADNVPSAKAIAKGLAEGHSADKPGYWIHICGTGILQWYDETHRRYGQPPVPEETYDDIKDIDRIINIPDQALHRNVDKIVLAANSSPAVKTAIVGPPTIYGPGRGPVNQRSIQVYDLAKLGLRKGYIPYIGTGKVEWDNVHIHDVSSLLISLVEAALDPARNQDPELFGPKGYFFAESGTHTWGGVAQWIAEEAHRQGFLKEPATKQTDLEEVTKEPEGNPSWATNSKSKASRARKYFGWTPKGRSLKEEIPDIVAGEAKSLGLKPSH